VHPVGINIDQIVNDIDAAGKQAKQCKACQRKQQRDWVAQTQLPVEYKSSQHKYILCPLARPHCLY
jgi:hypothetical protein